MHIDGEPVNAESEVNVRIVHEGLKVFAPTPSEINERKRKENENIFSALTRWFN